MTFKPYGPVRTLFDLFIDRASGSDIYAPIWHDAERLSVAADGALSLLTVSSLAYTEFRDCPAIFIQGADPFDYQIVGYDSESSNTITTSEVLGRDWPIGTRIFPACKCRIEVQPQAIRKADRAFQSRLKFSLEVPNLTSETIVLPVYSDEYVLEREPNDVNDLTFEYQRLLAELDNQSGRRKRIDINAWGSTVQQFTFFLHGRADHAWARALFYTLQGRRVPLYVPTFFSDLELAAPIAAGTTIDVKRCGYTDYAGPFRGREHVVIVKVDGTRLYRKILSSVLIGGGSSERLTLDTGFTMPIDRVKRISFVALCRLDSDSVETVHHTDARGLATCITNFRSIPQDRNPTTPPGFAHQGIGTFYNASSGSNTGPFGDGKISAAVNSGVIIVIINNHQISHGAIPEVSSVGGLHFARIGVGGGFSNDGFTRERIEVWFARTNSTFADKVITVNFTAETDNCAWLAASFVGLTGIDFGPEYNLSIGPDGPAVTINTVNPTEVLVYASSNNSEDNKTPPDGFTVLAAETAVNGGGFPLFMSMSYQIVSTIQTGRVITPPSPSAGAGFGVVASFTNET